MGQKLFCPKSKSTILMKVEVCEVNICHFHAIHNTIYCIICILQNEDELEDSLWKNKKMNRICAPLHHNTLWLSSGSLLPRQQCFGVHDSSFCFILLFQLIVPCSSEAFLLFLEHYVFNVTPSMPPPAVVTRVLSTFKDL